MQGFNKYYPPDFDPQKTQTLNDYRGVHALGKRAKDIDKGILVVRFELPYNIWCGTCNAHIGAGVRYNAQKRKVGNYYSTPIFAFRCKCHLCSGWFEIRTDPKNARYVVEEGARAQASDWNPEENGGHPVFDTEAPPSSDTPTDAFAHLEKTIIQKTTAFTKAERLTQLTQLSHRHSSDPYTLSQHARARFRTMKKADGEERQRDEEIRKRIGLGVELMPVVEGEGRDEWMAGQSRREGKRKSGGGGGGGGGSRTEELAIIARANTMKRLDIWGSGEAGATSTREYGKGKISIVQPRKMVAPNIKSMGLVDYDSEDG